MRTGDVCQTALKVKRRDWNLSILVAMSEWDSDCGCYKDEDGEYVNAGDRDYEKYGSGAEKEQLFAEQPQGKGCPISSGTRN